MRNISSLSAEWIWINHGRPFREMNDVNHLYYQVCSKCEFFLNDGCMICRCRLVPNELSAMNKLSMATTNCPLPQPKWIIVAADTPDKAFAFAQDPALINEGMRLVRKEGLLSPGVTGSAIPVASNEKGEVSRNPMGVIDPNVRQRYHYSITYEYLGED